ncbi:MAG: glycosyltransferase family 39 protein [Patescibacteria group bacterium]
MLYLILILSFLLPLFGINQSFWLDEAAQVIESVRPLSQQFNIQADFWPPFYHLLLHFWMLVGNSEIWVRLLSVCFAVASVFIAYLIGKDLLKSKTALLGAVLLAINPFFIWYAQEARPYMLSVFFGLLTSLFLSRKKWILYTIAVIFFLYTTYLSIFLLISHLVYICVFGKKMIRKWFFCITISMVALIPWMPSFFRQLLSGSGLTKSLPGWSEAVSVPLVKVLPLTFTKFILGRISIENKFFYGLLVIVLFIVVSWLTSTALKKKAEEVWRLLILTGVPILSAFLLSFVLPILAPQRVLFVLPFFMLILAIGIQSLTSKRVKLIITFSIVALYFNSIFQYMFNPKFGREQWRQAVEYIEKMQVPTSIVIFVFPDAFAPWQWYSKSVVEALAIAPSLTVKESELSRFSPLLERINRIYYFHYLTDLTDPKKKTQKWLQQQGFIEVSAQDFSGVGLVTTYEKAMAYR